MDISQMNLLMMNNKIFRYSQVYLDKALKKFELSSGAFRYLFVLEKQEGISQNEISHKIGNDKAMSARMITKLMESGYIDRMQSEDDSRAYQLYLTDKAKEVIPKVRAELALLIGLMTEGLTEQEKEQLLNSLYKVFNNTQRLNG